VKIARLSSCKNFVSKREKFIFDAFQIYLTDMLDPRPR